MKTTERSILLPLALILMAGTTLPGCAPGLLQGILGIVSSLAGSLSGATSGGAAADAAPAPAFDTTTDLGLADAAFTPPADWMTDLGQQGAQPSPFSYDAPQTPGTALGGGMVDVLRAEQGAAAVPSGVGDNRASADYVKYQEAASASQTRKDCFRTVQQLAGATGGTSDWTKWSEDNSYRGQSLSSGLSNAIAAGALKPGMVVYANTNPGTDYLSKNLDNNPHWATYLGKDENGVDRFADNWRTGWSLQEFSSKYGGSRVIDQFADPRR